ncbi:MAG: class I SAM-dependent methyltransferase family protein, partial [Planctomycetales bacterium]
GKNFLIPAGWLKRLVAGSQSPLIAESLQRPGGWRSMEIVYRRDEPVDWLDRQALCDNPMSMAARNRRQIVTSQLARLINEHGVDAPVTILGVGAGPGWHVQQAIVDSGKEPSQVSAYLIDRDDDAFVRGRELAASLGIARSVHFLKGDARRIRQVLPDVSAQVVKLVGLIEYLDDAELVLLLHSLREVMVQEGSLLTHGLVDVYGQRRFLARVFNLRHYRRNARQLTTLLRYAGFRVVQCTVEPTGIHPILTAVRAV